MRIYLKDGKIIDGSGRFIESASILIENSRIARTGKHIEIPPGTRVIDCQGKTVMPGLIDAHVHLCLDASPDPEKTLLQETDFVTVLKSAQHAHATLMGGITTVRDMGAKKYIDVSLRDAIRDGIIAGPLLLISGKPITMTGGQGWSFGREADGIDDTRKAAREQLKAGVDLVKIMATGGVMTKGVEPGSPQLTVEEMRAAVEEAHKAGKKTSAHAQGTRGIKNALEAGVDSIEHGVFLDDEAIAMMVKKDVYLVPTLSAPHNIIKHGREAGIPEFAVKKTEAVMDRHLESFREAHRGRVKIAMGTDAGTPFNKHGKNALELELMVKAGMSAMEAIVSATKSSAMLLGLDHEVGTIEEGKRADILVVGGNPLEDMALFRDEAKIEIIIKDGVIIRGGIACSTL
jgi:imidazolonepropionase-like amidohydrolase